MIQALHIGLIVAVSAASFVGGCKHGTASKQGEWNAAKLSEAEAVKLADQAVAKHIAQIRVEHVEITKPIFKTVREVTLYRECRHADGVRDGIDKALTGAQ